MRVVFIQVKNGLLALACRCMKSIAAAVVSSSTVSIRLRLSGPVSSILPSADVFEHAARRVGLDPSRIVLREIGPLRLFLRVQVIEVAEEFIEAVLGRQIFVAVAKMILAELTGGIAERLESLGNRDVAILEADRRPGNADLAEAGAQTDLPGDERGSPRRAAVLRIIVGKHHAFVGDAVDVRRLVAHQAAGIGADVRLADVVAEDDENIRLCGVWLLRKRRRSRERRQARGDKGHCQQPRSYRSPAAAFDWVWHSHRLLVDVVFHMRHSLNGRLL